MAPQRRQTKQRKLKRWATKNPQSNRD